MCCVVNFLEYLIVVIGLFSQLLLINQHFQQSSTLENLEKMQSTAVTKRKYDIVVGILSSRGNFHLRDSLRRTWVGHASKFLQNSMLIKFIIANRSCAVPVEDRNDRYDCEADVLVQPDFGKDIVAYKVPKGTKGAHCYAGPLGMDFKVNYPVVVTHLGVFDSDSDGVHGVLIARLFDRIQQKEVVSCKFTAYDQGQLIGGTRFKPVPDVILPKGFEGSIVAENFSEADPSNNRPLEHGDVDCGGDVITFQRVSRFGHQLGSFPDNEEHVLEEKNQYAAGNFIYHVQGDKELFSKKNLDERDRKARSREQIWQDALNRESAMLEKEMSEHSDILLVDTVEVYRNLPRKILQFYKWAWENIEFNFTLKTDDDCFVDIEAVSKGIHEQKLHGKKKIWWGRFRNDWAVDRYGKWRETHYTASVYPSFACGAGNVLSRDLVQWLAENEDKLQVYQGEDVSLGIWLAAVGPTLVKDYRWSCFQECENEMFSSPEQDAESLVDLWTNLKTCGNPCECDKA